MSLGEKLKALRTAKKMSQKELAERIGIAKSGLRCPKNSLLGLSWRLDKISFRAALWVKHPVCT